MKSANDGFDGLSFSAVDSRLFFTRNDPQDSRLGDLARALPALSDPRLLGSTLEEERSADERHFVIAGYPDDEGIRINGGRPGAAHAPDAVRKPLYKMTPPLEPAHTAHTVIWDAGNLKVAGQSLEERHRFVSSFALATLKQGATWIGLGGGHDYGFPDADAYITWAKSQGHRPLILNFDAHLDVRPVGKGISSGTPFFRMLEKHPDVDFAEIGIQGHCNSRTHLEWAAARGARMLMQEEIEASGESFTTMVLRTLDDWALRPRSVFLSVDIDGFSSSVAPGCSQSWATGFMPHDFFPCLQVLAARFDVRALGIYEVSPPLDHDDRTAKLAAQIIHRVIS
jgi:formiminoglutamase